MNAITKAQPATLQEYNLSGTTLRSARLDDGKVWVCLKDAGKVLKILNHAYAVKAVFKDELRKVWIPTNRGVQETYFVSESGVRNLMLRASNTPEAEHFRKWLTRDVSDAIQNDGGYIDPNATPKQLEGLGLRVKSLAEAKRLPLEQREQYLESAQHLSGSDTYALIEISVLHDNAKKADAAQKARKATWGGVLGGKPDRPDDVYFGVKDGVSGQYHHTKAGKPTKLWEPA